MYITNKPEIAKIAEDCGVDWIFVDLETIGKAERQGHLDTVMSKHSISDIQKIKTSISKSEILVRSNPIHKGSEDEIEQIIANGADIIMLPYFKTFNEVKTFLNIIDGRTKTCLLLETSEAVEIIDEILELSGIDFIHIGLNDLHLSYGMSFMFEPLANGMVEKLAEKIKNKSIPFGFGGIAKLGMGTLPAEKVISEHYRLDSKMAILSRSFCNTDYISDIKEVKETFQSGMNEIREFENTLINKEQSFFEENRSEVLVAVEQIKSSITKNKN